MIAMPVASAGRRSPLRHRGMSGPPDDDFRFLDDLYAVRSIWESDDGCLLFFDPKNAHRIFYVHINRLLVHIGAFDPVHIGLLLSAKHTTPAEGGDSPTAPCTGIAIESDARVCYMVLLHLVTAVAAFLGTIIKHVLWQQRCLEIDSRLHHVGVVDETRRTYRHHGRQRDAPRRIATFRHATLRVAPHRYATLEPLGKPGGSRAFSADGLLKRLWLRDGHVKRNTCERMNSPQAFGLWHFCEVTNGSEFAV